MHKYNDYHFRNGITKLIVKFNVFKILSSDLGGRDIHTEAINTTVS